MAEQNTQTNSHSQLAQALAVSARELAQMLDVSLRQVWRLNAAGRLPEPVQDGGSVRWNREQVQRRFEAGCRDRQAWEATKEGQQS